MFHARDDWAAAMAGATRGGTAFGRRPEVESARPTDARQSPVGAILLGAAALALAPGLEPLPGGRIGDDLDAHQAEALAIAPLSSGSGTGLSLVQTDAAQPLTSAPERTSVDLYLTLGARDSIGHLLARAGAQTGDARAVEAMVPAGRRPAAGAAMSVTLGARAANGLRSVERVSLRGGLGETLQIVRGAGGLALVRQAVAIDTTPLRIRGRVGDGLYWSLRAAGVTTQAATQYLQVIGGRIDVGADITPADRFDLVIANRRAANGDSEAGALLYAGLDRAGGSDLAVVRWTFGGRSDWFDANAEIPQASAGMMWPVAAPITSGFGMRVHPILRFARMHRGIDFGAGRGTPVYAAADGQVSRAGWAGGYGRQVRLAHAGGLATSYSHLSGIVADGGSIVRRGQLIGYVGSSGLSTGPHLHYEVYRGGVAVNPTSVRFTAGPAIDDKAREVLKARVRALLAATARRG